MHHHQETQMLALVFSLYILMDLGVVTLGLVLMGKWGYVKYITEFYLLMKQVRLLEHKKQDSDYNEFNNRWK
jgi:predicted tellurium resistance membrane protein TerC